MSHRVLLNHCISILRDEYSFVIVFVYVIFEDEGEGLFAHFDTRLSIKSDQIILQYFGPIIEPSHHNSVLFIPSDGYIFLYLCHADHLLVRTCIDTIFCIFIYFVQINKGEATICFNSVIIFTDIVSTYLNLTGQSNFDPYFVFCYLVLAYFHFELLSQCLNADGVSLYFILSNFGLVIFDSPNHNPTFSMITNHTVLHIQDTQPTHDTHCVFLFIALDLGVIYVQLTILVNTNSRNQNSTRFYQIFETEHTDGEIYLTHFHQHYHILYLIE